MIIQFYFSFYQRSFGRDMEEFTVEIGYWQGVIHCSFFCHFRADSGLDFPPGLLVQLAFFYPSFPETGSYFKGYLEPPKDHFSSDSTDWC